MNDKLLSLAEHKTRRFQELATLLEYPEIQADKGYYLSLYNEFESLRATQDAYASFLAAASSLSDLDRLTAQTEEERAYLAEEKRTLFEKKALLRSRLVALLTGGADAEEKVAENAQKAESAEEISGRLKAQCDGYGREIEKVVSERDAANTALATRSWARLCQSSQAQ